MEVVQRGLDGSSPDRLEQEVVRLGGNYAHLLNESVESKHDDVTGEAWLHGRYSYMVYRQSLNR